MYLYTIYAVRTSVSILQQSCGSEIIQAVPANKSFRKNDLQ